MQNDLLQTVRRYCKTLFDVNLENKNSASADYGCILRGGVARKPLS
jgi:hypothetical protein